ncbi:hypothetical protein [Pseudomonas panipatensis]|uniref:Uncharacterized protein n=1 Tax=Pseudomonas panipatensis TaxID=428992 RepID=A0A1G8CR03_9PSED|nr:hypothetical protein [Pseudomonas panipatensis]SDH47915.1 hypothetical protein SAMN05216272_101727 [Pseudomonas panipatensis]SMP63852.1 hypothetical protein SAMN06295951_106115 [Pseudomonas panipatensis]
MNLTELALLHPLDDNTPLALYDAAHARHRALRDMLHLLAGAPDLGSPSADVMTGALACLEFLAVDSERLYQASQRRRGAAGG